jgi:hypothetical protein
MKKNLFKVAVVLGLLSALAVLPFRFADAQDNTAEIPAANAAPIPAAVFQAAGPTAPSIQSSVDQFRAALGLQNNLNNPGPLAVGRREIKALTILRRTTSSRWTTLSMVNHSRFIEETEDE